MSLSKQLLILISALFLMIFSVNFALSVNNIKDYLEAKPRTTRRILRPRWACR